MGRWKRPTAVLSGDPSDASGFYCRAIEHLEYLGTKGFSAQTIKTRRFYLTYFVQWCADRSLSRPTQITKPILERYQRYLYHYRSEDGRPLSFQSQHHRLSALKVFFRWLAKNNLVLSNPAADLELLKVIKRLPKHVLSANEVERILNQPDAEAPLGMRDRAMMETFYSTGMRRSELLRLKLYDLDAERGTVMIREGKGGKDRMIPIGERALMWLEKYLADVRPTLVLEPDEGTLFLTARGADFLPENLTSLVAGYVDKAGIAKKGSCHLFRHAMATLMLENGADIRFIQAILGHARLETTQIYTQVSIKQLKEIHSATHPAKVERKQRTAENDATADDLLSSLEAEAAEEES